MEQNVANNTMVKKPHAGNSGAVVGAGATAAAAASTTDVEQGKSLAKSSSPLKEKFASFTQELTARAKQVTERLYKSPNKKCSKSEEGDESHSEGSPKKKENT